jgi:hypothetical protein
VPAAWARRDDIGYVRPMQLRMWLVVVAMLGVDPRMVRAGGA